MDVDNLKGVSCFPHILIIKLIVLTKLRDFIMTYNQIADECFNNCVFSFNNRDLTNDEVCLIFPKSKKLFFIIILIKKQEFTRVYVLIKYFSK